MSAPPMTCVQTATILYPLPMAMFMVTGGKIGSIIGADIPLMYLVPRSSAVPDARPGVRGLHLTRGWSTVETGLSRRPLRVQG